VPDGHGGYVTPYWIDGNSTPDPPHDRASEIADLDGGKMDGFVEQMAQTDPSAADTPMGYYNGTQLAGLWGLAQRFVLCDMYFAPVLGPTVPNRLYAIAGSSDGITADILLPGTHLYTIFDQLSEYGFSWSYYYQPSVVPTIPLLMLPLADDPSEASRVVPLSGLVANISSGNLPAVTFVDPE